MPTEAERRRAARERDELLQLGRRRGRRCALDIDIDPIADDRRGHGRRQDGSGIHDGVTLRRRRRGGDGDGDGASDGERAGGGTESGDFVADTLMLAPSTAHHHLFVAVAHHECGELDDAGEAVCSLRTCGYGAGDVRRVEVGAQELDEHAVVPVVEDDVSCAVCFAKLDSLDERNSRIGGSTHKSGDWFLEDEDWVAK